MAAKFDFKSLGEPVEIDWPVKVKQAIAGGKFEEASFSARFKVIPLEELQVLQDQAAKENKRGDDAILEEVLVGLGKDEDGDLTPELKAHLIRRDDTRTALVTAYGELVNGSLAVKN